MCTFSFLYADGATVKCEHIVSAAYVHDKKRVTISEDELASCIFRPTERSDCIPKVAVSQSPVPMFAASK